VSDLLKAIARSARNPVQEIRPVANPVVGTDLVIPAANGQDWRVLGVRATLTASAAVANRTVTAVADDQTNIGLQIPTGITQVATIVTTYVWVAGLSFAPAAVVANIISLTLPDLILPTGWRFRTLTAGLDVGDQWSGVTIYIERMDEPPWRNLLTGTDEEEAMHDYLQSIREGEMS